MKHVLILEDTLEVLAALLAALAQLERRLGVPLQVTVYSSSRDVEEFVNHQPEHTFDAIVLDRNCKVGGSFHILELEKFDPKKVVSTSSMSHHNTQAGNRGVERLVTKDHHDLTGFSQAVTRELEAILA